MFCAFMCHNNLLEFLFHLHFHLDLHGTKGHHKGGKKQKWFVFL